MPCYFPFLLPTQTSLHASLMALLVVSTHLHFGVLGGYFVPYFCFKCCLCAFWFCHLVSLFLGGDLVRLKNDSVVSHMPYHFQDVDLEYLGSISGF